MATIAAAADTTAEVPSARLLSGETQRLYAADWHSFVAWCRAGQRTPLPAAPDTVAIYLSALAATLSPGALNRRLAAIRDAHRQQTVAFPRRDPSILAVLREARAQATRRRVAPPPPAQLLRMAAACPGDLAGLRDRALLLLMATTSFGRAALVGLDAEQIDIDRRGMTITPLAADGLRHAAPLRVTRSERWAICPVAAMADWLHAAAITCGPVFRKVDRWGTVDYHRLGSDAVRGILARRARRGATGRQDAARRTPGAASGTERPSISSDRDTQRVLDQWEAA